EKKPIYICHMPSKIYNSQSVRLVYVLPKFVLGSKEKLQLELQELNGSSKIVLKTTMNKK
ncbi:MAG: conjugal transfer protein, partial [Zunongwangia sp.]